MKPKSNYVALGAILVCALTLGTYSCLSVYMMPIAEKFNADLSQVALIFTLANICGLITNLMLGNILKKIGVRRFILFEGIAVILFFLSISMTNSLVFVFIGAFLFGLVNGGFGACQTAISMWFAKGQGTLISLLSVGMGIAAMILSPLISRSLMAGTLDSVALFHGLAVGIIVILSGLFLIAEEPARYGMQPVGYEAVENVSAGDIPSLPVKSIMKTSSFWLIILAVLLLNCVNGGVLSNAASLYQSIGASQMQASICISIYNGVLLAFSPLFGTVADKKGPGPGAVIIGASTIAGAVCAITMTGMGGAAVTAALISACGVCGSLGGVSLIKTFGAAESGTLIGYALGFGAIGQMISAPLAAKIYVTTGSFNIFMLISILLAALVIACILVATSRQSIEKSRAMAK